MAHLRRYFIAGLLVWIPIWVTVLIIKFFVDILDKTMALLPEAYQPDTLLGVHIPGIGVVVTVVLLFVTGLLVTNFIGRHLVAAWDAFVSRIPLVRSLHSSVKQVLHTVFAPGGASFRRVLLIEYPRRGLWSIAFQTSEGLGQTQGKARDGMIAVFVPTTPNPTSGFLLMVHESEVREPGISVDAALKMVISLGVVMPVDNINALLTQAKVVQKPGEAE